MYRFATHKTLMILGIVVLGLTPLAAETKVSYPVAYPEHYPFHDPAVASGQAKVNIDGAVIRPAVEGDRVHHSPVTGYKPHLGTEATPEVIAAWDIDVRPDGKGLPPGSMTVEKGAEVFAHNCASCHGEFGEGAGKNPVLAGGEGTLQNQARTGGDEGPEKTIGSYAPYIAPFFWYIKVAMPLPTPKKLTNDEVYGILGYLLQLNEIEVDGQEIEDDTVIDATLLKKVHLPNEKGFEYNDLRHPYSHGERCMTDCIDPKKVTVMRIDIDATDTIEPSIKLPRYSMEAPQKASTGNAAQTDYKASCAACHDSGVAGAPVIGKADEWKSRIAAGKAALYDHAINGLNGMPPRGGNMELSDDQIKAIVDYMIQPKK